MDVFGGESANGVVVDAVSGKGALRGGVSVRKHGILLLIVMVMIKGT
jgi:hypothetical protein